MAMKSRASTTVMLFDVVYEDGTRNSNRRVLASSLGFEGDKEAQAAIEEQDRAIAASSGRPRSNVKSVVRSPIKVTSNDTGSDRKAKGQK